MKLIIILLPILILSCLSSPDRDNYKIQACFEKDLCMYLNQKNPDKSFCKPIQKQCLNIRVHNLCKNKLFRSENQNYQSCWDKLK